MLTVADIRPIQLDYADEIIAREGGYVDHPVDKGGPTNFGVTLVALQNYLGDPTVTAENVKSLSMETARNILIDDYFIGFNFDLIDNIKAYAFLLDCSVNHSQRNAVIILQRAVGTKQDGALGGKTAGAANRLKHEVLMSCLIRERGRFFARICKRDPSQIVFLEGWLARLHSFLPY